MTNIFASLSALAVTIQSGNNIRILKLPYVYRQHYIVTCSGLDSYLLENYEPRFRGMCITLLEYHKP